MGGWGGSVERAATLGRAAHAGDLLVLDGELVVVGDLLVHVDVALGVDDDLLLRLHGDDLGIAVGLQQAKRRCREKQIGRMGQKQKRIRRK